MMKSALGRASVLSIASVIAITVGVLFSPAAASAASPAKTTVAITSITPSSGSKVVSGENIKISGTTSSNLKGKTLKAQVKVGASWQTLSATATVTSKGTYALTTKAIGLGATTYRVVFPASKTLAAASTTRATTVWKWFYLSEQKVVEKSSTWNSDAPAAGSATVRGKHYANAVVAENYYRDTVWSEWNLSFQCTSFLAVAGVGDGSATATAGTSYASLDGTTVASSTTSLQLGKTQVLRFSVADTMRLRLTATSTSDGKSYPVWANARVLCKEDVNPAS